jgi:hypothetical protein
MQHQYIPGHQNATVADYEISWKLWQLLTTSSAHSCLIGSTMPSVSYRRAEFLSCSTDVVPTVDTERHGVVGDALDRC